MSKLAEIVAHKRREVAARIAELPTDDLAAQARAVSPPPDFRGALAAAPMGLIAEVKRRSPSRGDIRPGLDPAQIARAYEAAGAQAISVLMDAHYFGGGAPDFCAARAATRLPLLYKEFIVDPWQVWHARRLGAAAALLIVAALPPADLTALYALCAEAGLAVLMETHTRDDMARAAALGATIIGINNRDLGTFKVDLATTEALAPLAPPGALLVSESGIHSAADVARVRAAGARAVLVGESLLSRPDVGQAIRDLMAGAGSPPPLPRGAPCA